VVLRLFLWFCNLSQLLRGVLLLLLLLLREVVDGGGTERDEAAIRASMRQVYMKT
jgi:hypothetical protein